MGKYEFEYRDKLPLIALFGIFGYQISDRSNKINKSAMLQFTESGNLLSET